MVSKHSSRWPERARRTLRESATAVPWGGMTTSAQSRDDVRRGLTAAARTAHAAGDWQGSYAGFTAASSLGPLDTEDLAALAIAARRLGRLAESTRLAELVFTRYARRDPVLAGEQATETDAVETTDQFAVLGPRLDAVGDAEQVQPFVGLHDAPRDPPVRSTGVAAPEHRLPERGVDPDLVAASRTTQRPTDDEPVDGNDPSGIG